MGFEIANHDAQTLRLAAPVGRHASSFVPKPASVLVRSCHRRELGSHRAALMKTTPLVAVASLSTVLAADQMASGKAIPALDRLRVMSADEWQDFVLEYAHSLKTLYSSVERHAGAGDLGCDVVARVTADAGGEWDNYQCKHYKDALAPGDTWIELGKFCYYSFVGEYTVARKYYLVAPKGAGRTLSNLLNAPDKLRVGLLDNWDSHCRENITSKKEIPLSDALRKHISDLDFSIFSALSPLKIIEQHATTPWHAPRFGGGLKDRAMPPEPPKTLASHESAYIRSLLDAYEERLGQALAALEDLKDVDLIDHLQRARREFYSAEALREFSRDNVPLGTFEQLLDEVYSGIIDVIQAKHPDAMERVLASVKQAKALALASNALVTRVSTADKGGMCHQLANNSRVTWRK